MTPPTEITPSLPDRVREELAALFDLQAPATVGAAPACIDAIGGLLAPHGGAMTMFPIDSYAHVLAQPRSDGQIVIFDFAEYDEKRPFTLQIGLDALLAAPEAALKANLAEPGRRFAAPVIAVLFALRNARLIQEGSHSSRGFNLAVQNDDNANGLPAIVATALALTDGSGIERISLVDVCRDASAFALGQAVSSIEIHASLDGKPMSRRAGASQEPFEPIVLPEDVCLVAAPVDGTIDGPARTRVDVAARIAHRLILRKMRDFGAEAGRELISDPMGGQLGRLAMADYKRFFRSALPESMRGEAFLRVHGEIEGVAIDAETDYAPQLVADHLVIEGHRASEWVRHLDDAKHEPDPIKRQLCLDKAGHLLYASHKSARDNCGIGSDEADRMVDAVRANESAGFFGARLSNLGSRYLVAILCRADASGRPSEDGVNRILSVVAEKHASSNGRMQARQAAMAKRVTLSDVPARRA